MITIRRAMLCILVLLVLLVAVGEIPAAEKSAKLTAVRIGYV